MSKIYNYFIVCLVIAFVACDYELIPDQIIPDVSSDSFNISEGPYYENCTAIQFTNTVNDATSFEWDFGDGFTSTIENPAHTYATAGTYIVKLKVNIDAQQFDQNQEIVINPPIKFTEILEQGKFYTDVLVTDEGDYVLLGIISSPSIGDDKLFFEIRDNAAQPITETTFNLTGVNASSTKINKTTNGGYLISAQLSDDFLVIKTNSNGSIICSKNFKNTFSQIPVDATKTTDGGFAVLSSNSISVFGNMCNEGVSGWLKQDDDFRPEIITLSSDNSFIVAGVKNISYSQNYGDFASGINIIKIDNTNSTDIFFNPINMTIQNLNSVFIDGNDDFIASSVTFDGLGTQFSSIEKITSNGTFVGGTSVLLDNGGSILDNVSTSINAITEIPGEGYIIVAGVNDYDPLLSGKILLNKVDYNLALIWDEIVTGGNNGNSPNSVALTPDCGFIIAGSTIINNETSALLIKTDSKGKN